MTASAPSSSDDRTGVILAAGFGSRLAGAARPDALKPLTEVAGTPLIVRTLRGLEKAGCRRAVIVLGYKQDTAQDGIAAAYDGPVELTFAFNEQFDLQNGLSVLAARLHVAGTFVLVMADHVVSDAVMARAGAHTPPDGGATLLVDYKLETIFDMDDATKVQVEDGRVQAIGKQLTDFNAVDTGVFVGTAGLMDALDAVYQETGDAALSDGVRRLAAAGRMHTLDIEGGFWQDVDTPAMLAHAEAVLAEEASETVS